MIYATSPGEVLVTVTDEFVNNISLVISVLIECVIFAWLFNMEKLIAFLNAHTRIMKIGKWWTVTVRYNLSFCRNFLQFFVANEI